MRFNAPLALVLVSCLTFFAESRALAYSLTQSKNLAASPFSYSLKVGGDTTLVQGADTNASLGTSLEYQFFKTYALGAEYSLYSPFTQFDDYVYNGSNDLSFYLGDSKIWANRYYGLNLGGKLSFTVPTSHWSQEASIYWAAGQSMTLKKTFSDRESVTYFLGATEYSVQYIEAYIDDETGDIVYNTRFDINNRLTYSIEVIKNWTLLLGGGIRTYNNYMNSTYNIYRLGAGSSIAVSKSASLDFAVTSFMKDSRADRTWNGPANSDHFFDAKGTLVAFSLSFKI